MRPSFTVLVTTAVLLISGTDVRAGLSQSDLAAVSLSPAPNAAAPLSLEFRDVRNRRVTLAQAIDGRPAILVFVDYTCRTICGPVLAIASGALSQTGLDPGKDFGLLVIGLDAKDSAADALAMSRQIGDLAVENATTLLLGDARNIHELTEALGYRYKYDAAADQFAHPAGALVMTPDGRISRVLSSLGLNARDLRLALVEAGAGSVGTLGDRLTLLCYGFDAVHGVYTPVIKWMLQLFAVVTLIGLVVLILVLRRNRDVVGDVG